MDPKTDDFSLLEEEKGTFQLISLSGQFTARSLLRVRKALEQARSIGHNRIAVDLSLVDHMDSTALGLLINAAKSLHAEGGELVALNPGPAIQNLIQVSNAQKALRIQVIGPDAIDSLFD